MRKSFLIHPSLLVEKVLTDEMIDGKRFYTTPTGFRYPSITTVLKKSNEKHIKAWIERVGAEEAEKITRRAATRGSSFHTVLENFLNNKEDYKGKAFPNVLESFYRIKDCIEENVDEIYSQEEKLYSDDLRCAGRVDLIATWNGIPSIVDFKSARSKRSEFLVYKHFLQESFYSHAWHERTGMKIEQIVTVISADGMDEPQTFIKKPESYIPEIRKLVKKFEKENKISYSSSNAVSF